MALAQQLAELALANSQGLLNDDEYRLLRQNLFEQHSNTTSLPFAGPASPKVQIVENPSHSPTSGNSPLRKKSSFTASVTTLLKRGGGDKVSQPQPPSAPLAKSGFFPRLQRKASEIFFHRTEDKRVPSPAVHSFTSISDNSRIRYSHNAPHTPLESPRHLNIPTFPSSSQGTSTSSEIFDGRGLYTSKDIRAAIIATEAEAQRILEAFDSLESSTSIRVAQQNARRLRCPTPEHVITLLDGSNWRQYTPTKAAQSERKTLHFHGPTDTVADALSVRSNSPSSKTSLSRSKSISSLRSRQAPTSPVSARFPSSVSSQPPSILRTNSVSSIASQVRFGGTPNTSLSRSTGHLPLDMLVEDEGVHPGHPGTADADSHPQVSEVHRHRTEVMARYNARLEYLQARLRSAELHEKLLRR